MCTLEKLSYFTHPEHSHEPSRAYKVISCSSTSSAQFTRGAVAHRVASRTNVALGKPVCVRARNAFIKVGGKVGKKNVRNEFATLARTNPEVCILPDNPRLDQLTPQR